MWVYGFLLFFSQVHGIHYGDVHSLPSVCQTSWGEISETGSCGLLDGAASAVMQTYHLHKPLPSKTTPHYPLTGNDLLTVYCILKTSIFPLTRSAICPSTLFPHELPNFLDMGCQDYVSSFIIALYHCRETCPHIQNSAANILEMWQITLKLKALHIM